MPTMLKRLQGWWSGFLSGIFMMAAVDASTKPERYAGQADAVIFYAVASAAFAAAELLRLRRFREK